MIIPCPSCGTPNRVKPELAGRPLCGKCQIELPAHPAILAVDDSNFAPVIEGADRPVLVDFWATWCGPCRMLAPVLEKFAGRHPELQVLKVDTDQSPGLSERFQIAMVPTLALFEHGQEKKRVSGVFSLGDLEDHFGGWLAKAR